jgi:hypothetical protein
MRPDDLRRHHANRATWRSPISRTRRGSQWQPSKARPSHRSYPYCEAPGATAGLPSSAWPVYPCGMSPAKHPHRKRVRHYHDPGHCHELTFSCYHRWPLLTNNLWRSLLSEAIDRATRRHDDHLAAFVYMPEHVHLLVFPGCANRRSPNRRRSTICSKASNGRSRFGSKGCSKRPTAVCSSGSRSGSVRESPRFVIGKKGQATIGTLTALRPC